MHPKLKEFLFPAKPPWVFLCLTLAAIAGTAFPSLQESWVFDKGLVAQGQWWRIWTGHLVHFGWPHVVADGGLFLILGRLLERSHLWEALLSLVGMPVAIALALAWGDPHLARYGGLSGVDFGLLVFLALQGWQKNWVDWFWPSVLAIYVLEVVLESTVGGGAGGGMIRFRDPSIRVATMAHVGGGLFGAVLGLRRVLVAARGRG